MGSVISYYILILFSLGCVLREDIIILPRCWILATSFLYFYNIFSAKYWSTQIAVCNKSISQSFEFCSMFVIDSCLSPVVKSSFIGYVHRLAEVTFANISLPALASFLHRVGKERPGMSCSNMRS